LLAESAQLKRQIPLSKIESLVLFGRIGLSAYVINYLLEESIPVTWLSNTGRYYGRLDCTTHINIERQRLQFRFSEDESFRLELSKRFILGKISNQIVLLRRYNREREKQKVREIIVKIAELRENSQRVSDIKQAAGCEGMCARLYFEALSMLIDRDISFSGRSRRPPEDKFNSMLSFGYTLMMYEVYNAIELRGLNPYAAFLHKDRTGHPALASDLMEEWRPVIVDSLAMSLANTHEIKPEHFYEAENAGIYLTDAGRRVFLDKFEKRIRRDHKYTNNEFSMNFRQSVLSQVTALCSALENKDASLYKPVIIR